MKESKNKKLLLPPLLVLLAALVATVTLSVRAKTADNEFIISAANYDNLADHATNCTFAVDKTFAATWCADGYFAIDDTSDLISPNTAFKVSADENESFVMESAPKDMRLDTFFSMVESSGEKLAVIKRSDHSALYIELDKTDAPKGVLLGGFFSPDFVVFQILNEK